ncbi:MAG: membrane protease subunit HflK [Candidatus Omnitrophota bacterium]|jgi:membrane protease subunit HflK
MDFKTPEDLLGLTKKFPMRPGLIGLFCAIFLVLLMVSTMFYSIGPDERGVVLFLGKYVRTTQPGLNTRLPFGIETFDRVKVERIFKEEFGFRTQKAGVRTTYSKNSYLDESLMLTGDLNALEVTWIVQFKVKDPYKLLYTLRDPVGTIRDICESVMRMLVGDYSVDEVLTTKRVEISTRAEQELQKILDSYDSGIDVVTIKLQDVSPPEKVKNAFNEVNEAKQEKEQVINEAKQKYNKIIPKAKGEAERTILEAQAYSIERTNRALGDVARFKALVTEYALAPEVTRSRIYLESMAKTMALPKEKFIIDPSQKGLLPLLDFRTTEGK